MKTETIICNFDDYTEALDCPLCDSDMSLCQLPGKTVECPDVEDDDATGLTLWQTPKKCPLRKKNILVKLGQLDIRYEKSKERK